MSRQPAVVPASRRVCGGVFTPDPDVPPCPLTGQLWCRCGLAGKAGDPHHDVPATTEPDVQQRRAGERGDG